VLRIASAGEDRDASIGDFDIIWLMLCRWRSYARLSNRSHGKILLLSEIAGQSNL